MIQTLIQHILHVQNRIVIQDQPDIYREHDQIYKTDQYTGQANKQDRPDIQ